MAEAPSVFYKAMPNSILAQHELRQRVSSDLITHFPAEFQSSNGLLHSTSDGMTFKLDDALDPLHQLSQMTEEDFILIQEVEGTHIITAACNPYFSSSRLVASGGHALPWAHKPVPELTEKIRITHRSHAGDGSSRHALRTIRLAAHAGVGDILSALDSHANTASALQSVMTLLREAPDRGGELFRIRVERQTLSRLSETNAVAFSIHTNCDPPSSIATDMASLRGMLTLLHTYSPQRLRYSEMEQIKDCAIQWLESAIERGQS